MQTEELTLQQLEGSELPETVTSYCQACLYHWQQQNLRLAMLATSSGLLVTTPDLPSRQPQVLLNLRWLMQRSGVMQLQLAYASLTTIRTLLEEAQRRRQQSYQQDATVLADSRAQQRLQDIVEQALSLSASDVHLRFKPTFALLSFRQQGRLTTPIKRSREAMVEAIAASLNNCSEDFNEVFDEQSLINASLQLQFYSDSQASTVDLRLRLQQSPCVDGFAVTLRIQQGSLLQNTRYQPKNLLDLGMPSQVVAQLRLALAQHSGLILIIGATGQGKTTTLAGLNRLIEPDKKVISLEDPIEIEQPYIEQKPVKPGDPQRDFAAMVKIALREDPDILSISEIRDRETALAAYRAVLTGHLVTATIHAASALGACQRLADLGVSYQAQAEAGVLRLLLHQRLTQTTTPQLLVDCVVVDDGFLRQLQQYQPRLAEFERCA
ncbi:ATPase, T2SS/T4P/T4SS family [Idiomarina xiamenensis]|uniref:General secretory system type II protein, ATPase component n=1 Tax=Idiomarina xiamenensis 10-D-4 TaxID=740709 RepID=K2JK46_9GAMM|nr:ATPase, T2SS/T4P/T4SS family [Idiomarina xiamenensis]EKE83826.1 general secretory system type II protein, ATPase component [Idiomarina xiamenensis 10-D-4]